MKQPKKWVLYALLTLAWTCVIFSFSLQPAKASSNLSGGMLQRLLDLWFSWTNIQIPLQTFHHLFRKAAHFGEFFLLGSFALGWFRGMKKGWLYAWFYCVFIAVSDETLQFFTGEGRAMRLSDMGIDILGAITGILAIYALCYLLSAKKQKHS